MGSGYIGTRVDTKSSAMEGTGQRKIIRRRVQQTSDAGSGSNMDVEKQSQKRCRENEEKEGIKRLRLANFDSIFGGREQLLDNAEHVAEFRRLAETMVLNDIVAGYWRSLPAELKRLILYFSMCDSIGRASPLPLVCKQWNEIYNSIYNSKEFRQTCCERAFVGPKNVYLALAVLALKWINQEEVGGMVYTVHLPYPGRSVIDFDEVFWTNTELVTVKKPTKECAVDPKAHYCVQFSKDPSGPISNYFGRRAGWEMFQEGEYHLKAADLLSFLVQVHTDYRPPYRQKKEAVDTLLKVRLEEHHIAAMVAEDLSLLCRLIGDRHMVDLRFVPDHDVYRLVDGEGLFQYEDNPHEFLDYLNRSHQEYDYDIGAGSLAYYLSSDTFKDQIISFWEEFMGQDEQLAIRRRRFPW